MIMDAIQRGHLSANYSQWFDTSSVNEVEREYGASISLGHGVDKSILLESYVKLRNEIIAQYRKDPRKYLSAEECARRLDDFDPSLVLKVHTLMDYWGFINFYAKDFSDIRTNYKTSFTKRSCVHPSFIIQQNDEAVENAIKPFTLFKCKTDASIKMTELKTHRKCYGCGRPCKYAYYILVPEIAIELKDTSIWCSVCYSNSNYLANVSKKGYIRVQIPTDLADSIDGTDISSNPWSKSDMEKLFDAISQYGSDWKQIAKNVRSGVTPADCIYQFLMAPLAKEILSKVKLPICFNNYSHIDKNDENAKNEKYDKIPFETSPNCMVALLSFLSGVVSPVVAAGAARAAMQHLIANAIPINKGGEETQTPDIPVDYGVDSKTMRKATIIAMDKAVEISSQMITLERDRSSKEFKNLIEIKFNRVRQKFEKLMMAQSKIEDDSKLMENNMYELLKGVRSSRRSKTLSTSFLPR
ncbi:bifunctional SANT-Myb domain/Homeobox-like domain superfamily/SWIRM domain/Myb domain/SANT domain/Winged helix-like DNA-binding domain superfamily [Babesia duncani]|uniref:Bifunctional SANT-Myb domain/Homeobox-like domain superfamily/SWIRM domain/Myb domain/SANT domain/Winged helix-like DNA-binding domain superfamily n=1 Tax=Babesia duncani TaxID=323732 RepID=A0AAD9UNR6_9APIC|nr:bifunctional SANT-Myb domain/Homeobox-like domain superfamily/SWIRM domain/Myb domain/SANT domain/Winged helix-like DNA-binding domain superfamily [Babesia duncani]